MIIRIRSEMYKVGNVSIDKVSSVVSGSQSRFSFENDTVWYRIKTCREFILCWLLHRNRISNLEIFISSTVADVYLVFNFTFSFCIKRRKICVIGRWRGGGLRSEM